jgi:hypothetical protein
MPLQNRSNHSIQTLKQQKLYLKKMQIIQYLILKKKINQLTKNGAEKLIA